MGLFAVLPGRQSLKVIHYNGALAAVSPSGRVHEVRRRDSAVYLQLRDDLFAEVLLRRVFAGFEVTGEVTQIHISDLPVLPDHHPSGRIFLLGFPTDTPSPRIHTISVPTHPITAAPTTSSATAAAPTTSSAVADLIAAFRFTGGIIGALPACRAPYPLSVLPYKKRKSYVESNSLDLEKKAEDSVEKKDSVEEKSEDSAKKKAEDLVKEGKAIHDFLEIKELFEEATRELLKIEKVTVYNVEEARAVHSLKGKWDPVVLIPTSNASSEYRRLKRFLIENGINYRMRKADED